MTFISFSTDLLADVENARRINEAIIQEVKKAAWTASLTPAAYDGWKRISNDIAQARRRERFTAACWSKRHGKPSILTGCTWRGCEEW